MHYCVSAENISVNLDGKTVLKNINLGLKRGEFVTVLGPSGSGKTTLLKTLLGFYKPATGTITVAGTSETRLIRKRTGYMPQAFDVDRNFPMLAGDVARIGAVPGIAEENKDDLNISSLAAKPFGRLSGGEKQKVMLAMVLSRKPGILMLDEPNLNLDMKSYAEFLKLVEKAHKKHSHTIIFVTHLISHIPASCGRIIVMKEGSVIYDGTKAGLLRKKNIMGYLYG